MTTTLKAKGKIGPKTKPDELKSWFVRFIFVVAIWNVVGYLDSIKHRWYVFEPAKLNDLARSAIEKHGNDTRAIVSHIVANLTAEYPPSSKQIIINPREYEWTFSNAGGAMGSFYVIHASLTEYLMVFGTPLGTEGHTGSYPADDYFNILVGEQWAFEAGALEKEVYGPGSLHHLPRGHKKQYKMHKGCFALELAQGWIPTMLPFGLADVFTSTLDFPTFYHTVRISGREMIANLLIGKI